ncbi:uncharacterized protein LOC116343302 [Contarinia nasturtii]|uniref:uncharacterized protein LOC116343302 n=1 Tax=Contarinia nasturtii TaxID=265458 RepID=UPI0012D39D97|nr:uncharacterized protein LOC116343302 [Contarinia nasturtii]
MITIICVILFSFGTIFVDCDTKFIELDELNYFGEPISFACVHSSNQDDFLVAKSNNEESVRELIGFLDNRKGLSLYFPGITSTLVAKDFQNAKEWFIASNTNICYITYTYSGQTSKSSTSSLMKKMINTHRVEFVVKETRDFLVKLKKDCSRKGSVHTILQLAKVTVVGLHFGSHIASLVSLFLQKKYSEMSLRLIVLDPVKTSSYLDYGTTLSGIRASFAQGIFTSKNSSEDTTGYIDIYIENKCSSRIKSDDLILAIHTAICQKDIIAIAAFNGTSSINMNSPSNPVVPSENEVLIGVYGRHSSDYCNKKFTLTVTCNAYETLRQSLQIHTSSNSAANDPNSSLKYKVDPIIFKCIHSTSQQHFDQARSDDILAKHELIGSLNNGRGLSLYFPEVSSTVDATGADFKNAKGWFEASDTNICYIQYALPQSPSRVKKVVNAMSKTSSSSMDTSRVDFVANEVEDFVTKIRKDCFNNGDVGSFKSLAQLTIVGINFGANIGSLVCRYLAVKNGESVEKLIGMNPHLDKRVAFNKEIAKYAQVICTAIPPGSLGDGYVYIKNECGPKIKSEDLMVDIHAATSEKRLVAIATHNGKGSLHNGTAIPKSNEILVGVYSDLHARPTGTAYILAITPDKLKTLKRALAN